MDLGEHLGVPATHTIDSALQLVYFIMSLQVNKYRANLLQ